MISLTNHLGSILDDTLDTAFSDAINGTSVSDEDYSIFNQDAYVDGFPVPIEQFIDDQKFLNLRGSIYKEIVDLLVDVEAPHVREADLLLGKGSGKSMLAQIYTLYGVYKVLCLRNPQKTFVLTPSTFIYSVNVSTSGRQARDNVFAGIKYLVEKSDWFSPQADIKSDEIYFEKGVRLLCGHSNFTAFLGYPTIRAVMDEVNYMVDNQNRSVAKDLYAALKGSLKTRFPRDYKILSISSDSTANSFLRQRYKIVKGEKVEATEAS